MDADEPALVPQWLKGGASSGSAFGSHSIGATSKDSSNSTKRNNPDWDDKPNDDRYKPVRHIEPLASRSEEDFGSWKPPQSFNSTKLVLNGRGTANRLYPEDRERAASFESRSARGRSNGYISQGRGEVRNGFQEPADSQDKRKLSDGPGTQTPTIKGAFEKNFPSLAEQKPSTYTPAVAPYKQNYLASKASGNWTSKLADSPATASPPTNDNNSNATTPPLPLSPSAPASSPPPKMSETLQQTLSSRASSADRQRLDQLAAKQSRQLIPVIASSNKSRTSAKFTPVGKPITRAPEPRKVLEAPAPSPFARKPLASSSSERGSSIARTGSAPLPVAHSTASTQSASQPSGMVPLKPAGSGKTSERTSFFESLRRKTSLPDAASGDQLSAQITGEANGGASEVPELQQTQAATAATALAEMSSPTSVKDVVPGSAVELCAESSPTGDGSVANGNGLQHRATSQQPLQPAEVGGKAFTKLQDLEEAEEVAFLRLLGWEEPEDGDDEGLTEEEIAAFKAATQARPPTKPQPLRTSSSSLRQAVHSMLSSSYGSNNSVSDTDSD